MYRTVNEHGVVSFSDTPPVTGEDVETMQIDTPPAQAPDEYLEQLDAMRETTDRMASDRQDREKHRAEVRELDARTRSYEAPAVPDYTRTQSYYPVSGGGHIYRPGRPPFRPGLGPLPEHPIALPGGPLPLLPQPRPTHNNAQLMRPILSRD